MGFFRRGVRDDRARFGSGSGTGQATQARQGPHLHGCSGCDYADGARRAWPRTDLRPSGEAGDSSPAQTGTCRRDRDPLVPGAQRSPRKRGRGRVGQIGRQRTGRPRGRVAGACRRHPAASLAHLGHRASEKKWPEARSWCERRHFNRGYVLRKKGKPDPTPARAEKRTASRFYQLKSGHALTGAYLKGTESRLDDHCWWCDPETLVVLTRRETTCSNTATSGRTSMP